MEETSRLGAAYFLTKPNKFEELCKAVIYVVANRLACVNCLHLWWRACEWQIVKPAFLKALPVNPGEFAGTLHLSRHPLRDDRMLM